MEYARLDYQFLHYLISFLVEDFRLSYLIRSTPVIRLSWIRPVTTSNYSSIY